MGNRYNLWTHQGRDELSKEELLAKYKDLQSNSEKGVQKIIKQQKEIIKVGKDPKRLVELYNEDPEVAKWILKSAFDGMDIEEYKEKAGLKKETTDQTAWTVDIEAIVAQRLEKDKVESEISSVVSQLPNDMKERFL